MIDLPSLWPEALNWAEGMRAEIWTVEPAILMTLVGMPVLALFYRDPLAFLLTALLIVLTLTAFLAEPDPLDRWKIAALACLTGLLAVVQAARLRRFKRRMREALVNASQGQDELGEVLEKLEREKYWRKAVEEQAVKRTPQGPVAGLLPENKAKT
jgi:hypothetical protein